MATSTIKETRKLCLHILNNILSNI